MNVFLFSKKSPKFATFEKVAYLYEKECEQLLNNNGECVSVIGDIDLYELEGMMNNQDIDAENNWLRIFS